ncbi:chaperone DnaJ-domain superfamily protein [Striga asiatica]|uniref:Chaperone DnaJ-domain superfamily protein n=1 Tax=Striga asiatica TaxID=4170 RepID=A0A5A7P1Q7_STRAF|nr:chaperone DnaJ-domain superfamily protein [Striga asiatica]
MESLSRAQHRRKHSSKNSFSFKNPYDDVFLSSVGERESLGARDYAEIFSGSSSIPVLDLSGLDEQVGSADCRSSKLDYNNIFGGFRNDDVGLPYEELFSGSAKKTKLRNTKRGEESGSVHASRKPKMSCGEASDISADGINKQFNMSFNKTTQTNTDESNGKTHIAQLHAVPGFTCFVDGNPRMQKMNEGKTVNSLKREVSRTWSFSAEVEGFKGEGGLKSKNSHVPEKSHNTDGVSLEPNFSKVPPPSSCPSNTGGGKDHGQSRASDFVSKKEVPENITGGDSWPPYFGDDYGENSVAAESVAALKRAMDQAQESIRIAKMIMDRKKDLQNGPKPRAKARSKVLEKGDKVDNDSYGSRKNNTKKKDEELDHTRTMFDGTDGHFTQSFSHDDTFVSAPPIEVKRVWKNAEEAKEHRRAFSEGGKLFSLNVSQRDSLYMNEKIELEKTGRTLEEAKTCNDNEGSSFPILVANESNSANLVSTSKLVSCSGFLETVEDDLEEEVTILCTEGPERAHDTSQRMQELGKSVGEAEQWHLPLNHLKEPEYKVERVVNTSERTQELDKALGDTRKSLRISQEDEVYEERGNDMDDKGKEMREEMSTVEQFTFLNFLKDSSNVGMNETLAQTETERESEIVSENKQNGYIEGTNDEEAYVWFESAEQIKESLKKEKDEADPQSVVFQEKEVVDEILELENDNLNQNHALDRNEPELPEEREQKITEEIRVTTSESESPETMTTDADNCAGIQKTALSYDSEETNDTIEEKLNNFQYEDAFGEHIAEAVDVDSGSSSTIFGEAQVHDNSTNISENQEAGSVFDLENNSDESHKSFKENDSASEAIESLSGTQKDTKVEPLFDLDDINDFSSTEILRRVASEEVFLASKLHNTFDNLPSDGKLENAGVMDDADPQGQLPEDDDLSYENSEIHDVGQESKISGENQPEFYPSNSHSSELDVTDVRQVAEQTCTSDSENMDRVSTQESEECAEGTNDRIFANELPKDELEPNSNESQPAEEQSEKIHPQSHIEPKETEKIMESEDNDENVVRTSSMKAKDTKEMGKPVESEYKENLGKTSTTEAKDTKANLQNSDKDDYQQRIEAIKRGREREKDRLAVERAIREARERAFAEARERAERAAVERAATEARQRAMAEAREKVEKSSHVKQTVDKSSNEAKLKAERAAVERATAEARERALEKAMSQKTTYAEGRTAERVSGSSRNSGLKHSFSSSDLENGTESAQRRKARLERHQRIMERAAKALAEKNRRDLLVQKEQAERNILGPDSGWQPIPLTAIVTTAAVKKAYRKATLYVHPDKLQQRGASIQQKYLCEKIFDLLKVKLLAFHGKQEHKFLLYVLSFRRLLA